MSYRLKENETISARRRGELQAEAQQLGKRISAERPRAFSGRLGVYWQAWRSEGCIDSSASGNISLALHGRPSP
jgi:hypothetical protein